VINLSSLIKENVFDLIPDALNSFKKGEFIIVVDDENRENEGDLVLAAEYSTPEKINFILKEARGLLCVPLSEKKAKKLELNKMVSSEDVFKTNFTVSVDAIGTGTGISAESRNKAVKTLASNSSNASDLIKPGHVFPLIAREGGVLRRAGHTEASIDLCKLSNLNEVAVICEIMNSDGSMARLPELIKFKKKYGLKLISIKSLIEFLLKEKNYSTIEFVSKAFLPTEFGEFKVYAFKEKFSGKELIALIKGKIKNKKNVLVRVHSACLTGDVFHSMRCDCQKQLEEALKLIQKNEGILLYIPFHEGRGIGLTNKIHAYSLQDKGKNTVQANIDLGFPADLRDYGTGAQVLRFLGLSSINLLTNNPKKLNALNGFGLKINKRIPLKIKSNKFNEKYLNSKKELLNHLL
jgi:3,4-dihydroxy 2-butanone 4-phosphate synthase / GTP cyclohydrolase II